MIASFHLVEYGGWVPSPPKRFAGHIAGLRFWRPLNVGGDFGWYRDHPGRRHLYPRLRPDFRHWAYYAVWEAETDLDAFLADPPASWADRQREALTVWLRPIAARGPWAGVQDLQASDPSPRSDGPVAHLVRLDLSLRGTLAMWGSAAPRLLFSLPDDDDLLLGVPLVDRPYTQPVSFSLWSSAEAARRFAHRDEGHRGAVERVQRAQGDLRRRYATAQFDPYRCEGSWRGRNPLGMATHRV